MQRRSPVAVCQVTLGQQLKRVAMRSHHDERRYTDFSKERNTLTFLLSSNTPCRRSLEVALPYIW